MPNPFNVDWTILGDCEKEVGAPLDYKLNAVAHLINVLEADAQYQSSPLHQQVVALMEYLNSEPAKGNTDADTKSAENALLDLEWFATVGKALVYVGGSKDPQMRRELLRFAAEPDAAGNQYLFYIAGALGCRQYQVDFVLERGKDAEKTPDLKASKDGRCTWIEANAKQPKREINTPERLWQLIRDIIEQKKQKFTSITYSPGMIVADISPAMHLINESGTPPLLKLRPELLRTHPSFPDGFIYRLYEDHEWHQQPENRGNVFSFVVDEFAGIDRTKYHVSQCLITITRQVWHNGQSMAFPKGHQLLVHRSSESYALWELSKHVYVVE